MSKELQSALSHPIWVLHKIGDTYFMDGDFKEPWKIAYYPIFEDGKTNEPYKQPRALVERPAIFNGEPGTDFREVPLKYLCKDCSATYPPTPVFSPNPIPSYPFYHWCFICFFVGLNYFFTWEWFWVGRYF